MIGKTISQYKILKKIGEGGMGEVYLAEDTLLFRKVAIKTLPQDLVSDSEFTQRFMQEARTASALNHPNICIIHELIKEEEKHFIVMEYIEGKTLREKLNNHCSLPTDEALEIILKVCDALKAAHAKHIIHRDIKPENIIISDAGSIKIMDFGLAKLKNFQEVSLDEKRALKNNNIKSASFKTSKSNVLGTVSYMSPEQIKNEQIDERTDIFSVGVVLFELLNGTLPFTGEYERETAVSILKDEPKRFSESDLKQNIELEKIVHKALSKNAANRYENITELSIALKAFLDKIKTKRERKYQLIKRTVLLAFFIIFIFVSYFIFNVEKNKFSKWTPEHFEHKQLTSEDQDQIGRISPNGETLAYIDHNFSLKINVLGQRNITEFKMPDSGKPTQVIWSSDGKKLCLHVVYSDRVEFIIQHINGEIIDHIPLSFENHHPISPIWSPDESKIAFVNKSARTDTSIRIINLNDKKIISYPLKLCSSYPTWGPNSRFIAYIEPFKQGFGKIRFLDVESGEISTPLEGLTALAVDMYIGGLSWSKSGKYIAFVGWNNDNQNLLVVPIKGKKALEPPEAVTNFNDKWNLAWPCFTDDETRISFYKMKKNRDIYLSQFSDQKAEIFGDIQRVTFNLKRDTDPCWDSDGKNIFFVSNRDGNFDIYKYNLDSKNIEPITNTNREEENLQFSPNGKFLSFYSEGAIWGMDQYDGTYKCLTRDLTGVSKFYTWFEDDENLFVAIKDENKKDRNKLVHYNINSGTQKELINNIFQKYGDISISPNSKYLAVMYVEHNKTYKMMVYNFHTKKWKTILETIPSNLFSPILWTVDSKNILYQQWYQDKGMLIHLFPIDGSSPIQVDFNPGVITSEIRLNRVDPTGTKMLFLAIDEQSDMWMLERKF